MELKCDEDGCGGKLELDNARGEAVCGDCGVVFENMLTDADTNSGSSLGENRHNEAANASAVTKGAKHGAIMNVKGDRVDAYGNKLDSATFRKYRDLARKDRSTQRDTDPMYASLMATIQEMFGPNMARAVELLARATGRKLKPWQEARRRTLSSNEKRMLKCPKTAICRAGGKEHPELRGATEQDNLQIMALAIASIASKWFRTITINEKEHSFDSIDPTMPLLWALRDHAGIQGVKYGCGVGQCGACTVHLNGVAVRSCSMPVAGIANQTITTAKFLWFISNNGNIACF